VFPADAKGLLKTAIRSDDPVIFLEHKKVMNLKGLVPDGEHLVPFGQAAVVRPGRDLTIVGLSYMVIQALKAADLLEKAGISAEVIDPRTTSPLDTHTLIESAKKTGRAIVLDEGYERYGVTAELASVIADGAFYYLDAPVKRMGAMDVPVPFSPALEDLTVPTPDRVTEMAKTLCGRV
jgi:pyruvate/2-oxoglutarate/acetoin dehydrogenase E1 component